MAAMPIYGKQTNKRLKNLLLQNQESFGAGILVYTTEDSRSAMFVEMMPVSGPLNSLRQGQICVPMHFVWGNVEKSFSQNVLNG